MGHQRGRRSTRNHGRGYGAPRREKARAKRQKRQSRRQSSGSYMLEENHGPTSEEAAERTLSRLRNLGSQRFALSPFSTHFNRWLKNLGDVLSEFESSPTINVDDQFIKERKQILSNVEHALEERRLAEAAGDQTVKSLSDNRILLDRIEEEHSKEIRKIKERKNNEIKRLSSNIDSLREELDRTARMRTSIFRGISKKAKIQKEEEATQRLNSAQKELTSAIQRFTSEEERLTEEYERRKQPVIERIREQEKEVNSQETDDSLEVRRAACEALINTTNALLQRKTPSVHENH